MKHLRSCLLAALAAPMPAQAQQSSTAEVVLEYTDFTRDYGERESVTLQYSMDFGDTTVVLSGAEGRREFANDSFSATRGAVAVYHDWSDRFYTRTSASIATNDPVFPTIDVAQDFNFRIVPHVVLLVGGRYTRYFGDRDSFSWSTGLTYYFDRGFASYRYTNYDVEGLPNTSGHLASVRLNDGHGDGFIQLWLGAGSAVQEYEALPALFSGNYRSVALRRLQPLDRRFALSAALSHAWYDTGLVDYEGTTVRLGLNFTH